MSALFPRIFIPFAMGYFLSYFYRVVNAVIAPRLVAELGLTASDLGLLTASYFIAFAAFQLPLGVLLDHVGPRRVEASLLVFAAAGALVFGLADSTAGLVVGRALIGFGVSACLMAAFRSFVTWFPPQRLPLVNGLQMASGGLGALAATVPVELAVEAFGWRSMFIALATVTLCVALVIFLVIPERPREGPAETMREQLRGVRAVFTSALFWRLAPLTVTSQAAFLSVQGLWVGPWLRDVAGRSPDAVADTLFLMASVMVAGFIVNGVLVERLHRRGVEPLHLAVGGMTAFMLAQLLLIIGPGQHVTVVWLLFGYFGTTGILPYAVLSQRFPRALAGRLITALNLLVFVAAFAGQWGIGVMIELWPPSAAGGYQPAAYQASFAVTLVAQIGCLLWYALASSSARSEESTGAGCARDR